MKIALHVEESSIVLLKNAHNILPLDPAKIHSIAIIGSHADVGMISGGGSAQVDPRAAPILHGNRSLVSAIAFESRDRAAHPEPL